MLVIFYEQLHHFRHVLHPFKRVSLRPLPIITQGLSGDFSMKKGLISFVLFASGSLIDDTRMMIRLCVSPQPASLSSQGRGQRYVERSFCSRPLHTNGSNSTPIHLPPNRLLPLCVCVGAATVKSIGDTKPIMKPVCEVTQVH